ncbi:MAG TPA: ATP-binding protein, partial [Candidatus Limnocylindria bacterium]|nr:ATP-binding protein [Candidatus Limnocylindria bacterium]
LQNYTAAVNKLLDDQGSALLKLAVAPALQRVPSQAPPGEFVAVVPSPDLMLLKSYEIYSRNGNPLTNTPPPVPDERVWTAQATVLLERLLDANSLALSVPIRDASGVETEKAIVGVVDLDRVFSTAALALAPRSGGRTAGGVRIVVHDGSGKPIYQSDSSAISQGWGATASAPLPRLNAAVTVERDGSPFLSGARQWAVAGFVLALLLAPLAAFLLDRHVRSRSRGMARVEEDLSAIAKGEWDRRIVLQSSDDARAIADNINVMTDQVRAQIAREEESRQFESFIRLSAMLTHDLKNAIEGLSLTVSNMERHFDNEQFRLDAMKGLTNATDKLRAIVARLSRPVSSLSGEHKRPTKTDLIPILKRVMATTAEPMRGKHTIQTKLTANLFALADAQRVEEVMENLILNALEAMSARSGTLTIEAGPDEKGAPSFSVSDTGTGMSRTFIETRLFRPFATTKKNGIGLGLYTCREVIRASGGSITVQSVEGAGTTFRVVLPSIPHDSRN